MSDLQLVPLVSYLRYGAKFSAIKDEHEARFNMGNYFFKVFAKRLIRIVGVGIIGIVRIGIGEPDSEGESESDENRIGPKETVIGEKRPSWKSGD
jgi:hypothetical protein